MQKNVITLGGKRSLAGKNYKLAHEKRILGWAKMGGAAMVLGSKPNLGFASTLCKLQSYNFSRYSIWLC